VAVKKLIAERKKSTLTILVVAMGITLSVSVTSVLYTMVDSNTRDLKATYVTDYILSSTVSVNSTLPLSIKQDLERMEGVKQAMPISVPTSGLLVDFDFSRSNPDWLQRNNNIIDQFGVKKSEQLIYYKADLRGLVHEHVLPDFDVDVQEAAIFTKAYADNLGVKIGDQLHVGFEESFDRETKKWNMKTLTCTVAAIVDTLPSEPWQKQGVFLDWSHPVERPLIGETREEFHAMSVLVTVDPVKREQVVQGFGELSKTYTELRWADLQSKIEELQKGYGTQIATVWSVVAVVMLIGVLGMINTLSSGIQAKRREFAVLRAIYVTPRQLVKIVLTQSMVFALLAVLFGVSTSCVMAFGFASALDMTEWNLHLPTLFGVIGSILLLTLLVSIPLAVQQGRQTVTKGLAME
jgi:ABC-type antimicrobial peptide transport system permease subunit